ncbi:hypothetical protein ABW21_db0207397 [Orbilia brochopaga]|nr:hypothetical protein ABW21_db0207397 [Drechslerella brochopaga]
MSTYDDIMDTSSDKGKGKAKDDSLPTDHPEREEEEEESSSEEESGDPLHEEEETDELEPIDTNNIVPDRTRGKVIDYSKVDQAGLGEDEDDDDDDDFQDKTATEDDEDVDKMEH